MIHYQKPLEKRHVYEQNQGGDSSIMAEEMEVKTTANAEQARL